MSDSALEDGTPRAGGVRIAWEDLPRRIRVAVEAWLGAAVVDVESQPSGFSPGLAARVRAADGRRVFVKAVGPEPNPDSPGYHRREARIVAMLPAEAPVPRLLWSLDEGEGGWVVLAFQDLEGRSPATPWRGDELSRVLDALVTLSDALTPSPIPSSVVGQAADNGVIAGRWWRRLRDELPPHLDEWSARHLDLLAELESAAPRAVEGTTLLHFDLRADNLLLAADRVFVVDWPHARVGAAWLDAAGFAPSIAMQGGPSPSEVLSRFPSAQAARADDVTAAVAAIAGYFTYGALQPPPPGLPTLRAFQAAQGVHARAWLADRAGLW